MDPNARSPNGWAAAPSLKLPMLSPFLDCLHPTTHALDLVQLLQQQGYEVDTGGGLFLSAPVGGFPPKSHILLSNLVTPPRTPISRHRSKSMLSWTPHHRSSKRSVPSPLERLSPSSHSHYPQKSISCPSSPLSKATSDDPTSPRHSSSPQGVAAKPDAKGPNKHAPGPLTLPDDDPSLGHICITHYVGTSPATADAGGGGVSSSSRKLDRMQVPNQQTPSSPEPSTLSPTTRCSSDPPQDKPRPSSTPRPHTPLSRSLWSSLSPETRLNLSDLAPRRPPTAPNSVPNSARPSTSAGAPAPSPPRTPGPPSRMGRGEGVGEHSKDDRRDVRDKDREGGGGSNLDVLTVHGCGAGDGSSRPTTSSSSTHGHGMMKRRVHVRVPNVSRANMLQVFDCLDVDKNGKITLAEFEEGAVSLGFSESQAQRMFNRLDMKGHGFLEVIDWGRKDLNGIVQAFTQMYMQKHMGLPDCNASPDQIREYVRKQHLMEVKSLPAAVQMCRMTALVRGSHRASGGSNPIFEAFRFMDSDGSGDLTKEEIRDAFSALGVVLSDSVADQIMHVFDSDGNGSVNYYEFVKTMFPRIGAAMR